jgi:hypothetical protein
MSVRKIIQREREVAFAKNAQPVWLKILKYLVLGVVIYLLWGKGVLPFILISLFVIALGVHFWYRYKTKGWTKSFGGWKHDKTPNQSDQL